MNRFLREDRSYSRPWRLTSSLPSPDRTKTPPPGFRRADWPWSNAVDRTWLQTNHQDTRKHRAALPPDLKLSDPKPLPKKLFVPWSWLGQDLPMRKPQLQSWSTVKKKQRQTQLTANKYSGA